MNQEFWKSFIEKNDNFRTTCVLENCFNDKDKETFYKGVEECLYKRINLNILDDGIRIWRNGEQLNEEELKFFLKSNIPFENEDLLEYCKRAFNEKFGIILNNNECFSEKLASRMVEMVNPLCELIGIPPLGYEITVFIGNYGWTPLGIHKDHVGENVLHFHLGPGRKQMYIWDDETYEKLVGKDVHNNENIEPILSHAKKFDFGTGDLFFMPWFENHVGYSDEISIGVTLWFRSSDNNKFSKRILSNFISQFIPLDNRIIAPQINYLENHDTLENFKESFGKYFDTENLKLNDFIESIYLDYKYSLISNGGWSKMPLENDINEIINDKLESKKIILSTPFKILYKKINSEKLYIYVRGSRIRIKYHNEIISFLDSLNSNKEIEIQSIIRESSIPRESLLNFILVLFKYKGIIIID